MRLTVTAGERTVELYAAPKERIKLRDAEGTVLRLLQAIPAPTTALKTNDEGFGFTVNSDTQLAPTPPPRDTQEDEEQP